MPTRRPGPSVVTGKCSLEMLTGTASNSAPLEGQAAHFECAHVKAVPWFGREVEQLARQRIEQISLDLVADAATTVRQFLQTQLLEASHRVGVDGDVQVLFRQIRL